jgi:hypothetical protein
MSFSGVARKAELPYGIIASGVRTKPCGRAGFSCQPLGTGSPPSPCCSRWTAACRPTLQPRTAVPSAPGTSKPIAAAPFCGPWVRSFRTRQLPQRTTGALSSAPASVLAGREPNARPEPPGSLRLRCTTSRCRRAPARTVQGSVAQGCMRSANASMGSRESIKATKAATSSFSNAASNLRRADPSNHQATAREEWSKALAEPPGRRGGADERRCPAGALSWLSPDPVYFAGVLR